MRIVLVGAEFEENLAVRYLVAALEAKGHQTSTIVFNEVQDTERAARELAASGAPLAGLSMVFTQRAKEFASLAMRAREMGFAGHVTVGGHFAAFNAESLLTDISAIDSVAIGEGENLLCELAEHLDALERVQGLVWRSPSGIVGNPPAAKPPNLDALAVPPRKSPFDEYLGVPITNILSSRGCAHSCSFCSISAWHKLCGGDRVRLRAPESIADEMATLYRRGVRIFNFHDDSFVLPDAHAFRERIAELRRALHARGVARIAFAIKSRPDAVTMESFGPLKEMGLFRVFLGIEAGTELSLRQLGRRQTLADNVRALEIVKTLDLHAAYNLLLLNPNSTLEDLEGNIEFLRAHPDHPMNFCRTEIYSGTPLEQKLSKAGRLLGDYWGWNYIIDDPRAQSAFQLIAAAFKHRNFAANGLHHKSMQVDYAHQLLVHFFATTPELRQRVKRFIIDVNQNTCAHLSSIVDSVRRGALSKTVQAQLAVEFAERVHSDEQALRKLANDLLGEIQSRTLAPAQSFAEGTLWRRTAAAASIAATMSLAACKGAQSTTHPCEVAPLPTELARSTAPQGDSGVALHGLDTQPDASNPASPAPSPANSNTSAPVKKPPRVRVPPRSHHSEFAPEPQGYETEMAAPWKTDGKD